MTQSFTVLPKAAAEVVYDIHTDQLNTPRLITDSNGNAVWQWDNTDPFGDNIPNQSPNGTTSQFAFNLRFPGQYFDQETSTHYNYFRDYDSTTGRFIESDPIGLDGGQVSTYTYVNGLPLKYFYPRGLGPIGATVGGWVEDFLELDLVRLLLYLLVATLEAKSKMQFLVKPLLLVLSAMMMRAIVENAK